MNYMIIQRTGDNPKVPPAIVQMFTDKELISYGEYLVEHQPLDFHSKAVKDTHSRLIHLLQQWENKTL